LKGRTPKPTSAHKAAKTYRKDRHARASQPRDPLATLPKPPTWLSAAARKKWQSAGEQLVAAQLLTELDLDMLASYASTWASIVDAEKTIAKEGQTFAGDNGPRKHPCVAIVESARKDLKALAEQLGLTPLARQRIRCEPGGEEKDALTAFMAGQ
jgi:P27 family predicted phage terminase small subunit